MKTLLILFGFVLGLLLFFLQADAKDVTQGYQSATVVSVQKHQDQTNYVGDSPADAPVRPDDYAYDIGVKVDCNVYVGRYQSPTDYLPSAFAPNHEVDVRLQKHIMFVSLPTDDREVKMGILRHERLRNESCAVHS